MKCTPKCEFLNYVSLQSTHTYSYYKIQLPFAELLTPLHFCITLQITLIRGQSCRMILIKVLLHHVDSDQFGSKLHMMDYFGNNFEYKINYCIQDLILSIISSTY
jgi:hypothetical protein